MKKSKYFGLLVAAVGLAACFAMGSARAEVVPDAVVQYQPAKVDVAMAPAIDVVADNAVQVTARKSIKAAPFVIALRTSLPGLVNTGRDSVAARHPHLRL